MLKKELRIRKKEDFEKVFRTGKPLFFHDFALKWSTNGLPQARFGFSFSKKHLSRAVDRNRTRRLFSAILAKYPEKWPSGADIVIFSVRKPPKLRYDQGESLILDALRRLKAVHNS